MGNRENFMKLVSRDENDTLNSIKHRIKYRKYYRVKQFIILYWLSIIDYIKSIK